MSIDLCLWIYIHTPQDRQRQGWYKKLNNGYFRLDIPSRANLENYADSTVWRSLLWESDKDLRNISIWIVDKHHCLNSSYGSFNNANVNWINSPKYLLYTQMLPLKAEVNSQNIFCHLVKLYIQKNVQCRLLGTSFGR